MTSYGQSDGNWIQRALQHFNYDAFRSRLKNAMRQEGILWEELCQRADVPRAGAKSAIDDCDNDFRPHLELLEKLAVPLGRTAEWLITGRSTDNEFVVGTRERTHQLIDDFAYKQELPEEDVPRLHRYVESKLRNLVTQTPQAVYRCGIPQTLRDVRFVYDEMIASQG